MAASNFVGVHHQKSKWQARISIDSHVVILGTFASPVQAAQERDK